MDGKDEGNQEEVLRVSWSERPLDPEERKAFRAMRRDWEWYTTALGMARRLSTWTLGVIGAIWAARELIAKVLKALAP